MSASAGPSTVWKGRLAGWLETTPLKSTRLPGAACHSAMNQAHLTHGPAEALSNAEVTHLNESSAHEEHRNKHRDARLEIHVAPPKPQRLTLP
jgi:hypothetical protein